MDPQIVQPEIKSEAGASSDVSPDTDAGYVKIPRHQWLAVTSLLQRLKAQVAEQRASYVTSCNAVTPILKEVSQRVHLSNKRTIEDILGLQGQARDERQLHKQKMTMLYEEAKVIVVRLAEKEKELVSKLIRSKTETRQAQKMHFKEVEMNNEIQKSIGVIGAENDRVRTKLKDQLFLGSNATCATCKARDRVSSSLQDQVVQKSREIEEVQTELTKIKQQIQQKDKIIEIFAKENPRIKFELKSAKEEYEKKLSEARRAWEAELEAGFACLATPTNAPTNTPTPRHNQSNTPKYQKTPLPLSPGSDYRSRPDSPPPQKKGKLTPTQTTAATSKSDSPEVEEIGPDEEEEGGSKAVVGKDEGDWLWAHGQLYGYEQLVQWYRATVRNLMREKLSVEEKMVEDTEELEKLTEVMALRDRDRESGQVELKRLRDKVVVESKLKEKYQAELKKLAAEVKRALDEKDREIAALKESLADLSRSVKSYFLEKGDKSTPPPPPPPPPTGGSGARGQRLHGSKYPILRM